MSCSSYSATFLLTTFDPRDRPTAKAGRDHYFRTCCLSVRPYAHPCFSKPRDTKQFPNEITTEGTMGLAEWIIDGTRVYFCKLSYMFWKFCRKLLGHQCCNLVIKKTASIFFHDVPGYIFFNVSHLWTMVFMLFFTNYFFIPIRPHWENFGELNAHFFRVFSCSVLLTSF